MSYAMVCVEMHTTRSFEECYCCVHYQRIQSNQYRVFVDLLPAPSSIATKLGPPGSKSRPRHARCSVHNETLIDVEAAITQLESRSPISEFKSYQTRMRGGGKLHFSFSIFKINIRGVRVEGPWCNDAIMGEARELFQQLCLYEISPMRDRSVAGC